MIAQNLNEVAKLVAHIETQLQKTGKALDAHQAQLLVQAKLALANKPIRKPISEEKVDDLRQVALSIPATKKTLKEAGLSLPNPKPWKDLPNPADRESRQESRQNVAIGRPTAVSANSKPCLRTQKVREMDERLARLLDVSQKEPVSQSVNMPIQVNKDMPANEAFLTNGRHSVIIRNLGN